MVEQLPNAAPAEQARAAWERVGRICEPYRSAIADMDSGDLSEVCEQVFRHWDDWDAGDRTEVMTTLRRLSRQLNSEQLATAHGRAPEVGEPVTLLGAILAMVELHPVPPCARPVTATSMRCEWGSGNACEFSLPMLDGWEEPCRACAPMFDGLRAAHRERERLEPPPLMDADQVPSTCEPPEAPPPTDADAPPEELEQPPFFHPEPDCPDCHDTGLVRGGPAVDVFCSCEAGQELERRSSEEVSHG